MKTQLKLNHNWTRNISIKSKVFFPSTKKHLFKLLDKKSFIPAGNQRSFGDNAINKNTIISLKKFNKIISFNKSLGIIHVESGILIADILKQICLNGWFFPVTPGSKYVSIGGIIANNSHGKNTKKNQIKHFIQELKIILPNGKVVICSKNKNQKLFNLSIGGFGLTGIIISAKIKLKKIKSIYINQKIKKFSSYKEFFNLIYEANSYEYYVSWIESISKNNIKGLTFFGKHKMNDKNLKLNINDKKLDIISFVYLKFFVNNYFGIRLINFIYKKIKLIFHKKIVDVNEFFYPQDKFTDFNKIYGANGFIQVQFVVKKVYFEKIMNEISIFFKKKGLFSSFIIVKTINEKGQYLNYTGNGISISMDLPVKNKRKIIENFMNYIFKKYNVDINFSKDSIVDYDFIKKNKNYLKFKKDLKNIIKKNNIESYFSKRLKIQ